MKKQIIYDLANDGQVLPAGAQLGHGQIALANESRLSESHYSEALTGYLVGLRDPNNLQATMDFLAPPVQSPRKFEFKKPNPDEPFYSEDDDIRSIGSPFKCVEFTGTTALDKTINKGLMTRVDRDQVDGMPNWQQRHTARLQQRILRNELRRGMTAALAVANAGTATWSTAAGKDPDADIITDLIAGADSMGFRANRILFGEGAWQKRFLSHRAQSSAGGFASSSMTLEQCVGLCGLQKGMISHERYQSSTTAKTKVLADIVLMFWAQDNADEEDPSNVKRFWTPCVDGTMFRVYVEEHAKFVEITVEHYSKIVVVHTKALRKLTIS